MSSFYSAHIHVCVHTCKQACTRSRAHTHTHTHRGCKRKWEREELSKLTFKVTGNHKERVGWGGGGGARGKRKRERERLSYLILKVITSYFLCTYAHKNTQNLLKTFYFFQISLFKYIYICKVYNDPQLYIISIQTQLNKQAKIEYHQRKMISQQLPTLNNILMAKLCTQHL